MAENPANAAGAAMMNAIPHNAASRVLHPDDPWLPQVVTNRAHITTGIDDGRIKPGFPDQFHSKIDRITLCDAAKIQLYRTIR